MKIDGGKKMFATDLVEGMRDQGKVLEEICVVVIAYDVNDLVNDFERKDGRHCGMS